MLVFSEVSIDVHVGSETKEKTRKVEEEIQEEDEGETTSQSGKNEKQRYSTHPQPTSLRQVRTRF